MLEIEIDGKKAQVADGSTVMDAASQLGIYIPHFCYHKKLSIAANCRMCLVQVEKAPKPLPACATPVTNGMKVFTHSELAITAQKGVMEFLLINHPLDCPICDQAGECKLQEQSTGYGRGYSRYIEQKNVKPKRTQLGPRVMLDDERCILCSRCIRFCKEIVKDDVLGFIDRGSYSTLTCFPGRQLANNYSLNTVDICPVGALTSTDFRFKMRVWFLKQTNSIDTESSVGANTVVWSREGVIYRITPRRNDEVNDTWLSDSARDLYKPVRAENRLVVVRVNGTESSVDFAAKAVADLAKSAAGAIAVVGSGRSSVEEQFLTKRLADALAASTHLVSRVGEGDKILISADRNPNGRGALITGLVATLPGSAGLRPASAQAAGGTPALLSGLGSLGAAIDAGKVKLVLSVGEDLAAAGLTAAQLAKVAVVYLGTHDNATAAAAKVVIPTLSVFEKSGTFVNQQFRLQKFFKCVPGPAGATEDLAVLAKLVAAVGGASVPGELHALWTVLANEVAALKTVTFANLPETGLLLDPTPYAALSFVEGETFHYKPAAAAAVAAG